MDYIDMNILYSKSMSFNYFLYYLYLSHSTEIVVKPSEVLSELKLNNVRKKDFEQFLIKNSSYNNFKDMKNFSLELFLKNLRKEIIENSQYKSNNYTDEQINYLINFFLSEKLNDLINYKIDILKSHLIKIDPIVLSKNSDQLDKIYNKIKNISLKYKNNCIDFYKDQIKFINIVGEKNMKKLSKLYDILEY
jgi:hypothetical protein